MKMKTYTLVVEICSVAWITFGLYHSPEEWYADIIFGIVLGFMSAMMIEWSVNVYKTVKKEKWRAFLIPAPEKPKKLPLWYRILSKIFP